PSIKTARVKVEQAHPKITGESCYLAQQIRNAILAAVQVFAIVAGILCHQINFFNAPAEKQLSFRQENLLLYAAQAPLETRNRTERTVMVTAIGNLKKRMRRLWTKLFARDPPLTHGHNRKFAYQVIWRGSIHGRLHQPDNFIKLTDTHKAVDL